MTLAERKAICSLLVKMDKQKDFSKKIGLINTSILKEKSTSNLNT